VALPPPVAEAAKPWGVPETPTAATFEATAAIAVRTNAYFIVKVDAEYIKRMTVKIKKSKRKMKVKERNGLERKGS
jgi:hypothetical protein